MKYIVSVAISALLCATANAQDKKSILDVSTFEPVSLGLPGILPVIIPTNSTASSGCVDDPQWWSGYGNCTSYTDGEYNGGFCDSDSDEKTGVLASVACPVSCNTCSPVAETQPAVAAPAPSTDDPNCVDDSSFKSSSGDCSVYTDGSRNALFCFSDVDESTGMSASVSCRKSCGTCGKTITEFEGSAESSTPVPVPSPAAPVPADSEDVEFGVRAADLSGCGVNRDCPACSATYGCTWNKVSGCTAGFGQSVCDAIATPDSSKADCEAYGDCRSCTEQAGCIFYQGQCAYSRGTNCLNDPFNCVNYPSQCPAAPFVPPPVLVQPAPVPPSNNQPRSAQCLFPPCFIDGSYCNSFQACGEGSVCQNSKCVPVQQCYYPPCGVAGAVCNYYQDCGADGLTCMNGRCVTDQNQSMRTLTCNPPFALCPSGEQCVNNICEEVFVPIPSPNPDNQSCSYQYGPACPIGQVCNGYECVTDPNVPKLDVCFYDYQCYNGQTCINGQCQYESFIPMYDESPSNNYPTSTTYPSNNNSYQPTATTYPSLSSSNSNSYNQPTATTYPSQSSSNSYNQPSSGYQQSSSNSYQPSYTNSMSSSSSYNPKPTSSTSNTVVSFCLFDNQCGSGMICENSKCVMPSGSSWSG